jgi:tRNA(Arg) A34 adenosine deaminase TadA
MTELLLEDTIPYGVIEGSGDRSKTRMFKYILNHALTNHGVRNVFKLAAAVVYKKTVISIGLNQMKTHPLQSEFGTNEDSIYLHAEIDAIRKALQIIDREQLRLCDMYVARVKKPYPETEFYVTGLSKPCPGCLKAIRSFGIKNVYFTEDIENESMELQNYEEARSGRSCDFLVRDR